MAFVALTSLMRTIEVEFLQPNPRLLLQNKDLIISIHQKLGHLLVLLDESEKKAADNREEMRDLMVIIRKVSFKAEDDIEASLLVALHVAEMLRRDSSFHNESQTAPSSLFPLVVYPKTLDQTLWNVLQCIEELMEIIIMNNTDHFVKDNLQLQDDGPSSTDSSVVDLHENISNNAGSSSQRSISKLEDAMVGHSTEFEEVMAQIFQSSLKQRQVMAIVGMGGIGKTTFARRIYDDPKVASHFNLRGWTTVSQEHSVAQVLLELCGSIRSMPDEDTDVKCKDEVAAHLRRSLLGQRYLIVVDDIWTQKAWDEIQRCFPDENNGSRILLTTRQKEVAEYANAGEYSFNMRFLDPDEGWKLFYQKLHVKECLNKELETVGRNIVKKCQGLPLAIVLLAGLLSSSNKSSLDEWKNLETTINSLVALDLGEQFYSRIFSLSYNSLPHYLKACFLHLGVFPEDREIPIKKLIRLWIAEGLITTRNKKRLEEVGEDYLHELINRSLVMISGQSFDGKIKTCKIHDLLHDLCESKIKKEKLLHVHVGIDDKFDNQWKYDPENRWSSLRFIYPIFNQYPLRPSFMRARSIFYFNTYTRLDALCDLHANSFKRLRVLDLSETRVVERMPDDIMDLVFLRYLALTSYNLLCCIPVWRNWNLQTLIVCEKLFFGVNWPHRWIWQLPKLRHLKFHFNGAPKYPPEVVQENLQTFYWLYDFQSTKQVLLSIPNVKVLGIFAPGKKFHGIDNLYLLNHLEKLTMRGNYFGSLQLFNAAFPLNLKKLTIMETTMGWEDMRVVSILPNLEVLKLKKNNYEGQEWELTENKGFLRLKVLVISSSKLRDWKAGDVDDPFPVLERLLLKKCLELKEMPSWIEGIHTLQLMQFDKCRQSLVNSAWQIQEERQSYGDDGLVIQEVDTQPGLILFLYYFEFI